jgi:nitrogen fixation/metabolism regulation signal transduction histidine kinase
MGSDRCRKVRSEGLSIVEKAWAAIRWKMMIIFSFVSIISVALVICFSITLLNVVIRRESAYLIEERIKIFVESSEAIIDPALDRLEECEYAPIATA